MTTLHVPRLCKNTHYSLWVVDTVKMNVVQEVREYHIPKEEMYLGP